MRVAAVFAVVASAAVDGCGCSAASVAAAAVC